MIKTNNNIFEEILNWSSLIKKEITLFSPFVSKEVLERINDTLSKNVRKRLLVRLQMIDVISGITNPQTIRKAIELGFEVRFNFHLHAKVFWNENRECYFGSANLTSTGLGISKISNFEEVSFSKNAEEFLINAEKFWNDSQAVSIELVVKLEEFFQKHKIKTNLDCFTDYPLEENIEFGPFFEKKKFSLLHIPQSESIHSLYSNIKRNELNEMNIHDIKLLKIKNEDSLNDINQKVLSLQIVKELLIFNESGKRFGELRKWLSENIENVPTPSREEINLQLNRLYKLITDASTDYEIVKYNFTEVLKRKM